MVQNRVQIPRDLQSKGEEKFTIETDSMSLLGELGCLLYNVPKNVSGRVSVAMTFFPHRVAVKLQLGHTRKPKLGFRVADQPGL